MLYALRADQRGGGWTRSRSGARSQCPGHPASAAAGGSAPGTPSGRPMYRVGVRMPDGSLQLRDLDKPEFKVGDNVLLTNAGDIVPD